ncbi:MAG: GNAT family N-acetyltransferase [Pseudomonadota bacterium]|nr:GNAT family N-acetyltransferase [Pseudomonadota bacterium]
MTGKLPIRPVQDADLASILDLNNRHASELSWLEPDTLARLVEQSFFCRVAGPSDGVRAFLLTFDQDAAYDSPNFLWFRARYPRFVYVDRVVVDPAARGRGLARLLYGELAAEAARAGHRHVTAEVNADPPNPVSDAFHRAIGFTPVGEAAIHGGTKTVRYWVLALQASG